jgi:hypothetical protein
MKSDVYGNPYLISSFGLAEKGSGRRVTPLHSSQSDATQNSLPFSVSDFFEPQPRASPFSQQIISSILSISINPSTPSTPGNRASSIVHSSSQPFLQRRKKTNNPPVAIRVVVSLDLTRSEN